jgi:amidophosphoribosyltransferase
MRVSCPPIVSPCFYGVDTPRKEELIAAANTIEDIRRFIGADSLGYLSIEGLKKACRDGEKTTYCTACYTGRYPTTLHDLEAIEPETLQKR